MAGQQRGHRGEDPDRPGGRLARSYLGVRAEQAAESQPKETPEGIRRAVVLPRLDNTHLNSPEAQAQYRLALLARLATGGEPWFMLAAGRERARP